MENFPSGDFSLYYILMINRCDNGKSTSINKKSTLNACFFYSNLYSSALRKPRRSSLILRRFLPAI